MPLRAIRRWMTAKALLAGKQLAPLMPSALVDASEWCMSRAGPHLPFLGSQVERNMRAIGVYRPEHTREYFSQMALHFANAARMVRLAPQPEALRDLAARQTTVAASISHVHNAMAAGRGVILAPAHTSNYVMTLVRLNLDVPICIFLRWSKDERRVRMKREWCEAAGLRVILEPPSAANPTTRAEACVELLRSGAALAITPDIAQKAEEGVPVRLFDRIAYLPSGSAALAMLAEAPLVPMFGRLEDRRFMWYFEPPISVPSLSRAQGGRKAAIAGALQAWANGFERFVRSCPPAWFLWGDSRWTRVFAMDPKYARPLEPTPAATSPPTPNLLETT